MGDPKFTVGDRVRVKPDVLMIGGKTGTVCPPRWDWFVCVRLDDDPAFDAQIPECHLIRVASHDHPTRCPNCGAELTPGHGDAACVRVLRGRVERIVERVERIAAVYANTKLADDLRAAMRGDDHA